jgi:hypothetical protein
MTRQFNFAISVLIRCEGQGKWAAQCLEYDIAAQGDSIKQATEKLEQTFIGQICVDLYTGKDPLEGISPAPRTYWNEFEQAQRLQDHRRPFYLGNRIPPAYMIQAGADDMRVYA